MTASRLAWTGQLMWRQPPRLSGEGEAPPRLKI